MPPSHDFYSVSRRAWLRSVGALSAGVALGSIGRGQADTASALEPRYPELKYINLAGNENPFGPSRKVSLAIVKEVANSCRYPFREEVILKDRIAAIEGVAPECVALGNGCDEILSLSGDVFAGPGSRIVATNPTYLQLMDYAEKRGAIIDWVNHDASMRHDLDAMLAAARAETTLMYVCNPDTPSGTVLEATALERFCRQACERCPVFVDEVYLDLLDDFRVQSQARLVREGLPIIIGRSFSKLHGLAGHRIGYAIGPADLIARLESRKMSSPSYLGVIAATASLDDEAFHAQSRRLIREGRERFCQLLDALQLPYIPSVGNFVFHKTGIEIRAFQAEMKRRNFLVGRPFPPYEDWCRISIGNAREMQLYEIAMREVFRA